MSKLNFGSLPQAEGRETVVAVPEFGEGMEVLVRGMTVLDKSVLGMQMQAWGVNERSAVAVIAALCCRDEEGALVFGANREEAIKRTHGLPERYWPALTRISQAAVKLSAGVDLETAGADAAGAAASAGAGAAASESDLVEAAEKN